MLRRSIFAAVGLAILGLTGEAYARSRRVNVDDVIQKEWVA